MKLKTLVGIVGMSLLSSCGKNIDGTRVREFDDSYQVNVYSGLYMTRQLFDIGKDGTLDSSRVRVDVDGKGTLFIPDNLLQEDHQMYDTLYPKIQEFYGAKN